LPAAAALPTAEAGDRFGVGEAAELRVKRAFLVSSDQTNAHGAPARIGGKRGPHAQSRKRPRANKAGLRRSSELKAAPLAGAGRRAPTRASRPVARMEGRASRRVRRGAPTARR